MKSDNSIKRLFFAMEQGKNLTQSAAYADLSIKTARKYVKEGKLPSQLVKKTRHWRTRPDPFDDIWEEVEKYLTDEPNYQAKYLFEHFQRKYPDRFAEGQLRSFQRKIKNWRALHGPSKEVYFEQKYKPGERAQIDYTCMNKLGITINGEEFPHLLFHFVLCFSNWEWGYICYSESYESLSEGLQKSLWKLGRKPKLIQTDSLSAAVHISKNHENFTHNFRALMEHYGFKYQNTNPRSGNENGKVEQRHYRLKNRVEQELLLRGSRDFGSKEEYCVFLENIMTSENQKRSERYEEDFNAMTNLPPSKLKAMTRQNCRVTRNSTISVKNNTYMVPSRLIGEQLDVHIYADRLELWFSQNCIDVLPRLTGRNKHLIRYQYVIDWLLRKPGAFENYKYREEFFPTLIFRKAYEFLIKTKPKTGVSTYLYILKLAAYNSETSVENILESRLSQSADISTQIVEDMLKLTPQASPLAIKIEQVQIEKYDELLTEVGCYDL